MKQVTSNKEKIQNLNQSLQNMKKEIDNGDAKLQNQIDQLKNYLEQKLKEINDQMNLLTSTNDLLKKEEEDSESNNNEENNKDSKNNKNKLDFKSFRDVIKKLSILRNDFDDFVVRADVDEIYTQLKYLDENKVDKRHINNNNFSNNNFSNNNFKNDKNDKNISKTKRDSTKNNNPLQLNTPPEKNSQTKVSKYIKNNINIDSEKYLLKEDFNSHSEQNDNEFKKIWDEIQDLREKFTSLAESLKTKSNISDINDIKDLLLEKINELALACNKKFADKNEIFASIKNLEEQLKKIISASKCDHEGGDWLIAKKPITGFTCAACEQYIGELKDNKNKYIPWNQFPMRDYGDKLYRLGNGFSRMLNMLNIENGNCSLNQNNISGISSSSNTARQQSPNEKKIINNKSLIKSQRYQSASCLIEKKETRYSRDEKDNKLPKLKSDVSSEVILEGNEKDDRPKITKVLRKSYQKFQVKEE